VGDWVLHVDLDQFVAAVEVLRDPSLAGVPVAFYEARALAVRSGMPLRIAARKAPGAVFLPVDGPLYTQASEGV